MNLEHSLIIDLCRVTPTKVIKLHQGDKNSVKLAVTITKNGTAQSLSNVTAKYDATISNYLAEAEATATIDGNIVYVPITENMTALNGVLKIDIKFIEGNTVLFTQTLKLIVEKSALDGSVYIDFSKTTLGTKLQDIEEGMSELKNKFPVKTADIANNAVTAVKIATGAVTTGKLAAKAVTTDKLAGGSVTTDKLSDGSVTKDKLADGSISADKILTYAVKEDKIEPNSITSPKIANGAVSATHLSAEFLSYIQGKADFVDLGTVDNWGVIKDIEVKTKTIYYVSTFIGYMSNDIQTGNCIGIGNPSINCLYLINTSTGLLWRVNLTEQTFQLCSKIPDGAINDTSLFSTDIIAKYLSMPVTQITSTSFGTETYNSLTTPGIYQLDSFSGTHQVVIVLKPDTEAHLMQIRLNYNNIDFRGIWCTTDGIYADDDWEPWRSLCRYTAKDTTLADEGDNYLAKNVEAAFLEVAQKLAKKADIEYGTVQQNNAWYTDASQGYSLTGNYSIIGDMCILRGTAQCIQGWGVVYYSLPVASLKSSTTLAISGNNFFSIATGTLDNISVLEIRDIHNSLMPGTTISFTLIYKCK